MNLPLVNEYDDKQTRLLKRSLGALLLCFYGFLFYLMLDSADTLDFLSFYASCKARILGENPYQLLLTTSSLPAATMVPANLNPPILFLLLRPLLYLEYDNALIVWSLFSMVVGLLGAGIAFYNAFSSAFIKKNGFYLYLIYLISFPTLMSIGLGQVGSILLGCLMVGYLFYTKHHDYAAGIAWGLIAAIKYFPLLLLVYVLIQKRYKVFAVTLGTFWGLSLVPILIDGMGIYTEYFSMMSMVEWYGKSWNASFFGMIFRLFFQEDESSMPMIMLYGMVASLFFVFYLKRMQWFEQQQQAHRSFCLTLVVMLLLSPFGWLYYFSLLVFPWALTWQQTLGQQKIKRILWFISLACSSIPINNIPMSMMHSSATKLSFYSIPFYGLLCLWYLSSEASANGADLVESDQREKVCL